MDKPQLLKDIEQAEGFRRVAYKDTRGFWTAGYGHKLADQTKDWTGVEFDLDTIQQWLSGDLDNAALQARRSDEWNSLDTDARQNALVELIFNMGLGTWETFTRTRMFLSRQCWAYAAQALLESKWAGEVGKTRSQRLANYILKGTFGQ